MADPKSREEYERRFNRHQRLEGFGTETTLHMPCPFCAAPDFIVARVVDVQAALAKGAVCQECGRGMRLEYTYHQPQVLSFEAIQTCGSDAPSYAPPCRRVEVDNSLG